LAWLKPLAGAWPNLTGGFLLALLSNGIHILFRDNFIGWIPRADAQPNLTLPLFDDFFL